MTDAMQPRTAAATAARKRASQGRIADRLREAGWTVVPPEFATTVETREEWGVVWPSGDDEVMVGDASEPQESEARHYANQFNPRPRVARHVVTVVTATSAWEDRS